MDRSERRIFRSFKKNISYLDKVYLSSIIISTWKFKIIDSNIFPFGRLKKYEEIFDEAVSFYKSIDFQACNYLFPTYRDESARHVSIWRSYMLETPLDSIPSSKNLIRSEINHAKAKLAILEHYSDSKGNWDHGIQKYIFDKIFENIEKWRIYLDDLKKSLKTEFN